MTAYLFLNHNKLLFIIKCELAQTQMKVNLFRLLATKTNIMLFYGSSVETVSVQILIINVTMIKQ